MNKKVWKRAAVALGILVAGASGLAVYIQVDGIPRYAPPAPDPRVVEITPARVERGTKLASMLCLGCHENAETKQLSGKLLAEVPAEFGVIYSKNITRHPTKGIGSWTDGDLRTFLRTGLRPDGTYVPPYMVKLANTSDEDLDSIIAFLRSDDPRVAASAVDPGGVTQPSFLAKALAHGPFKPLPMPAQPVLAPPVSDAVAYGRYLTVSLDCYTCHSANFTSLNPLHPEKTDGYMGGGNTLALEGGKTIRSANLTSDVEPGIGSWTEADFVRAVKKGFRPDGRVLHYPMEPKPELTDDEAAAIYAYLRSVPKIKNAVPRPASPVVAENDQGRSVYDRYGCVSCHGDTGKGMIGDLRRANEAYRTDAELRHWIDEAPSIRPGTKMPGWKRVIKEDDYPALIAHVRSLSAKSQQNGRTSMKE